MPEFVDTLIEEYKDKLPKKILKDFREEAESRRLNKKQAEDAIKLVKVEFDKAKISPGEAIGIVTAESFGEPGTQMSTQFCERILISINGKNQIVKIGDFVDGLIGARGSLKLNDDSEILPLNDLDVYVPSLNQEEKVEWKKVIECSRHRAPKKLVKINTASGREITCTDNHSFVTRINNSVVPINGKDLKVGNRIPVLNNFFTDSILKEVSIYGNEPDFRTKPIRKNLQLDWLSGWFIGAYLAEGNVNKYTVGISNINDNYVNNVKDFANWIGTGYRDKIQDGEYGLSRTVSMNSSILSTFVMTNCGQGSDFKKVPDFAYNTSNEFVSGLLRGYFDGDGNFHVDRKMIRASSNSKELTDGIALLLSRFKIFSYKVKDKKGQYWLLIPYKYAPLFLTSIGSSIDYKLEALEKLAEQAKNFWSNMSQDYTDMISGFGDLFYRTAKKLGYPTRYVNNFTKRQKIGRTALYRYMKLFEQLSKDKNIDVKEELVVMSRMFNSDVIWDEITEIEYVDYDHKYVYDLSVPGLETFTTADGIITHNTLNVFHFAGVAEVSVTQGLPRLIELLDARKDIKTPLIEIYIHKPHNKDADKVRKMAASIKETKLWEVASEFVINLNKLQVEVMLDKKRLRDLSLSEESVVRSVSEEMKTVDVKHGTDKLVVKTKAKENELMETYKLKEKLKDVYIRGVRGITQVLPVKTASEFMILAAGNNLKDVLDIKEVDETRTICNDLFEMAKIFGVEAARQTIINEASKVIEDQGLDVDIRHIIFISDIMTTTGKIRGITRSGITGEKESVLARASFETPIKHMIMASLIGEEDLLNSVVENVMLNQPVPLGTGLPDLIAKMIKKEDKKDSREKEK